MMMRSISTKLTAIAGSDQCSQRRAQGWDVATYDIRWDGRPFGGGGRFQTEDRGGAQTHSTSIPLTVSRVLQGNQSRMRFTPS
jgi:hypothetical protein